MKMIGSENRERGLTIEDWCLSGMMQEEFIDHEEKEKEDSLQDIGDEIEEEIGNQEIYAIGEEIESDEREEIDDENEESDEW